MGYTHLLEWLNLFYFQAVMLAPDNGFNRCTLLPVEVMVRLVLFGPFTKNKYIWSCSFLSPFFVTVIIKFYNVYNMDSDMKVYPLAKEGFQALTNGLVSDGVNCDTK